MWSMRLVVSVGAQVAPLARPFLGAVASATLLGVTVVATVLVPVNFVDSPIPRPYNRMGVRHCCCEMELKCRMV